MFFFFFLFCLLLFKFRGNSVGDVQRTCPSDECVPCLQFGILTVHAAAATTKKKAEEINADCRTVIFRWTRACPTAIR